MATVFAAVVKHEGRDCVLKDTLSWWFHEVIGKYNECKEQNPESGYVLDRIGIFELKEVLDEANQGENIQSKINA